MLFALVFPMGREYPGSVRPKHHTPALLRSGASVDPIAAQSPHITRGARGQELADATIFNSFPRHNIVLDALEENRCFLS